MSRTKLYNTWQKILSRCLNQNDKVYKNYGGRGIKVCDRWADSFENFLKDMGKKPSAKHSIERIDNNGDYSPENCRWATPKEQTWNRRNTIYVDYNGKKIALPELAHQFNMKTSIVYKRLKRGWDLKTALTAPVRT